MRMHWKALVGVAGVLSSVPCGTRAPAQITSTASPVVCIGACGGSGPVVFVNDIIILVDIILGTKEPSDCANGIPSGTTVTVATVIQAVNNVLNGCAPSPTSTTTFTPNASATPTASPTVTASPTAAATPTLGVLGTRHFVLNSKSRFQVRIGTSNLAVVNSQINGQTNGQSAPPFLDLRAGQVTAGFSTIDITGASDYFVVDARPLVFLCLKPKVPVTAAGVVGCNGGLDFSLVLTENHVLGQIGINNFTVQQCQAAGGSVESPNQICATGLQGVTCRMNSDCDSTPGAGDGTCGLGAATCTMGMTGAACHADADCDTSAGAGDGQCGNPGRHPGVCNGQFTPSQLGGDTGPGELIIAPFMQDGIMLNGLPVEIIMEKAPPCGDEPDAPRFPVSTFALTSGTSRTVILNANAMTGQTQMFDVQGQNFSCSDWQNPGGPGSLVLSAPLLDVPMAGDAITVFIFDGAGSAPTPTPGAP